MALRVYLAHSAHEKLLGRGIQRELEAMGYEVYNPFDYEEKNRPFWDENDEVIWDGAPTKKQCIVIIDTDLKEVENSDIMVCIYPEELVTFGITCEMKHAWDNGIPVYTYMPEKIKGHPWIVGMSEKTFTHLGELIKFMGELIFFVRSDQME